jgi:hypothetical protein
MDDQLVAVGSPRASYLDDIYFCAKGALHGLSTVTSAMIALTNATNACKKHAHSNRKNTENKQKPQSAKP